MEERYYEIVGVNPDATEQEIKKAYRTKSIEKHPDKRPASEKEQAEKEFNQLRMAYDVLCDPKAREAYDAVLQAQLRKAETRKQRTAAMDEKRRKMKDELERREREASGAQRRQQDEEQLAKERFKREMERLRKKRQAECGGVSSESSYTRDSAGIKRPISDVNNTLPTATQDELKAKEAKLWEMLQARKKARAAADPKK